MKPIVDDTTDYGCEVSVNGQYVSPNLLVTGEDPIIKLMTNKSNLHDNF